MNCHDVEAWMLSDETPNRPSADVRRHLRSCSTCRRQFGRVVRMVHELATAPLPAVNSSARDRLLAQIGSTPVAEPIPVVVALPRRRFSPPRWAGYAAAAVLFLGLGIGLALLVRPRPDAVVPEPVVQAKLEDRVLSSHLALARTTEPVRKLHALNDMATDVREETLTLVKRGDSSDLAFLVWLHARILHEGVQRVGRNLPGNSQPVVASIVVGLRQAEQTVAAAMSGGTQDVVAALKQIGSQLNETVAALQGGPEGTAPDVKAPVASASRSLLQVLVVSSLQVAHEEDPVKRADVSTEVAGRLADNLVERADRGETVEVVRLAEALQSIMERAVQDNLDDVDMATIDEVKRKQMEKVQERAGAAVVKVQPNQENMQRLPPAAQENLQRVLELNRQIQQMQQQQPPMKGKGPPWKRPKGPPPGKPR